MLEGTDCNNSRDNVRTVSIHQQETSSYLLYFINRTCHKHNLTKVSIHQAEVHAKSFFPHCYYRSHDRMQITHHVYNRSLIDIQSHASSVKRHSYAVMSLTARAMSFTMQCHSRQHHFLSLQPPPKAFSVWQSLASKLGLQARSPVSFSYPVCPHHS